MNLPTEIFGAVIVVHTPSELGAGESSQIQEYLTTREQVNVIVDLDGTEAISSEGLTALLDAQVELRERDGDLKITSSNAVNRKILEITRIDQQVEVFDSVIDAVRGYA